MVATRFLLAGTAALILAGSAPMAFAQARTPTTVSARFTTPVPTMLTGVGRPDRAMIVITHYQRLLDHIVPDVVHVLSKGRIVKTGGKELALELEAQGYAQFQDDAA